MKKVTDRPDFQDREVPPSLERLPRFAFTSSRASSREQSARSDIAFGVRNAEDLIEAFRGGFAAPGTEARPGRKKK